MKHLSTMSIFIDCVPGDSIEAKLANAKAAGFDAVECNGQPTEEARGALRALYERYGLIAPSVMNVGNWKHLLSSKDPEIRRLGIQDVKDAILTAKCMGAKTAVFVPGMVTSTVSYEEVWENAVSAVKELLPFAEQNGIVLAIENVWNKFLLSPIEFVNFIDSFHSDYLKAYFDVGNVLMTGFPQQWIRSLGARIAGVHIKGFHMKGFAVIEMGWRRLCESDCDWPAVMQALREAGFDGYFTAEPEHVVYENGLLGVVQDMKTILAL